MSRAGRLALRLLSALLPPAALVGSRRWPALVAAGGWVVGHGIFWGLAAGPGAILILGAMILAPFSV